jgi:hypothetical protein
MNAEREALQAVRRSVKRERVGGGGAPQKHLVYTQTRMECIVFSLIDSVGLLLTVETQENQVVNMSSKSFWRCLLYLEALR